MKRQSPPPKRGIPGGAQAGQLQRLEDRASYYLSMSTRGSETDVTGKAWRRHEYWSRRWKRELDKHRRSVLRWTGNPGGLSFFLDVVMANPDLPTP